MTDEIKDKETPTLITYIGGGKFNVTLDSGRILEAGKNLKGMIKYTYYEDTDKYPEIGWSITQKQLHMDYFPKAQRDILSGKLKPTQIDNP